MPFLKLDLDAKKRVPLVARAAGIDEAHIGWGLMNLWEHVWSTKKAVVSETVVYGCFPGERTAEALVAFSFLEETSEGFRVRGAEAYLQVSAARKMGAEKTNAKRWRSDTSATAERPGSDPGATEVVAERSLNGRSEVALTPSTQHPAPRTIEEEASELADANRPRSAVEALQESWNTNKPDECPAWVKTPGARREAARLRLKETPLAEWETIIKRIAASDFCRGRNDRQWVANPDWLLKPGTAAKVLEGNYDNRAAPTPTRDAPVEYAQGYTRL